MLNQKLIGGKMDIKQASSAPAQPTPQPQPLRSAPARTSEDTGGKKGDNKKSKLWLIIVAAVVVIGLVAAGIWWALDNRGDSSESAINQDAYQAVFLTNGQVYFGKLQSTEGKYATMQDIFYLQVEQAVQPSTENPADAVDPADAENNVQLIKLGNELHGPEDEMHIRSDQILFWENLKSDSKITEAINNYKE